MSEDKKLMRAKVGVILKHPFFATLLLRKKFIHDDSIKTLVTNGKTIRYNPEFVKECSSDELEGVICKSAMHTALLHHTRREGRDVGLWGSATDYAVNSLIKKNKMVLPKGYLHNPAYDDMAAEDIYKLLPVDKKHDENNDSDQPGDRPCGGVDDAPGDVPVDQQEAEAKQELAQAIQIGKQQGSLPGGVELMAAVLEPRVDWKEVLARFLSEPAKNDYSFSRPNRRYLQHGIILPSLYNLEVGEIVLIADTSGSMDEEALNRVCTEMSDVASSFKAHMTVLYVDTVFQGMQEIEPDDDYVLDPKGGGGTDFRPGFEWLAEHGISPKTVVYFTDGESDRFPEEPEFPVLWCITGGNKFVPPFGEVIKID